MSAFGGFTRGEQELAITLDSIGDGVIATDAAGAVMRMNPVAIRLTGWTLAEAKQECIEDVFKIANEETGELLESPIRRVLRDGKVEGLAKHTVLISRDGASRPVLDSASPIRGATGPVQGVVLVFRDASQERAAERALTASEARKTAILDSTFDAIISMGSDEVVVEFNAAAEKMFGCKRDEAIGKSAVSLLAPRSWREPRQHKLLEYLEAALGDGSGKVVEIPAVRADGSEFFAEIALTRVVDHDPPLFTASLRDVTLRRKAEEEARLGTAQLKASLRQREILLQEVHHGVKNNLQVISSLIYLQLRRITDQPTRIALEKCQMRVQAIALIHENLYQSKDPANVPFSEYAASLVASISAATGASSETVAITLDIEPVDLPVDQAIPCGLILNELITNAVKHAFPGEQKGVIQVALRRISADEITLSVADDGVGLPQAFSPNGQSLGMRLVSTLVTQLAGRLVITEGKGTMLSVTFRGPAS